VTKDGSNPKITWGEDPKHFTLERLAAEMMTPPLSLPVSFMAEFICSFARFQICNFYTSMACATAKFIAGGEILE